MSRKRFVIPAGLELPERGWSIHSKGYLIYSSKPPVKGMKRGVYLHREVIRRLMKVEVLPNEIHVHHQNHNKQCACPHNLIAMPMCMNPRSAIRDPHTGEFMSLKEYRRRYGDSGKSVDEPDWVTEDFPDLD